MDSVCGAYERDQKLLKILVRKPEGKRSLGISCRRSEGNIKKLFKYKVERCGRDSSCSEWGPMTGL
jgi:hypothetical protein